MSSLSFFFPTDGMYCTLMFYSFMIYVVLDAVFFFFFFFFFFTLNMFACTSVIQSDTSNLSPELFVSQEEEEEEAAEDACGPLTWY